MNASKRGRKPKANYDEMFANLPIHYEEVDTLTDEEKQCPACGAMMVPIGHEEIRAGLRYTKAKLERIGVRCNHVWLPCLQGYGGPAVYQG
ncbi:MAG: hypothetical protein ACLTW9_12135 [Enterocloster sp.]